MQMHSTPRTLRLTPVLMVLAALAGPGAARAVTHDDAAPRAKSATADARRTIDKRSFVLVGQGARTDDGKKVYDMALWVDEIDARRSFPALAMRAGGRDRARLVRGDHAPAFLIWSRFVKVAVLTFARDLSAEAVRAELRAGLEEQKGAAELVALFDEVEASDEVTITTRDNGEIEVTQDGETRRGPQSARLVRALWNVWLGPKAAAPELRAALYNRIDVLAR